MGTLAVEAPVSTILSLQLRRRDRRNRQFLKSVASNLTPSDERARPTERKENKVQQEHSTDAGTQLPDQVMDPTEYTPEKLSQWLAHMAQFDHIDINSNDTSGQYMMPSQVSKDAPSINPTKLLEKLEYEYKGGRNQQKQFHGKGTLEYDNGSYIAGEWRNGKKEGRCRIECTLGLISYVEGYFTQDKINGKVRVQTDSGEWIVGYAKDDVLHGFCTYYSQEKKLQKIGITRNGRLFGTCWKILPGGGFIVGKVDAEGEFTGSNIAYIFTDHKTAFLGEFRDGEMTQAQAVNIIGLTNEYKAVVVPLFSTPQGPTYRKEVSTADWLTDKPLQVDPYESTTVYVKQSGTPGACEGLFAARDLPINTVTAFYNGIRRQKPADSATTWQLQENAYKIFDPTNLKGVIDILPKYQDIRNWCASLAHKTNHSFLPNCEFSEIIHPRWGLVPCLVTRQDVKKDEEVLVWYGYDLDYCPDWYKDAWENSCKNLDQDTSLKSG